MNNVLDNVNHHWSEPKIWKTFIFKGIVHPYIQIWASFHVIAKLYGFLLLKPKDILKNVGSMFYRDFP